MKLSLQPGLLVLLVCALGYGAGTLLPGDESIDVPGTPAERGKVLAAARGCLACHSLDGSAGIGPSWMGVYDARKNFADGSTAIADDGYLRKAMLEPGAEVVAGFDNLMLPAPLNDEQIADIIALIRTLTPDMPQ